MAISDDWCIDYTCSVIQHVDGNLNWDTGTGTVPGIGDYIMDTASSKNIVMRLLVAFTGTSGTDSMTEVINIGQAGKIANNDTLVGLDSITFDDVQCTPGQGIKVGDTILGDTSTRTGVVRAVQYNNTSTGGEGTAWGVFCAGAWTCNELISVGGDPKVRAVGTGTDDDWAGLVACNLFIPPGTNNVMQIMNFDNCGTVVNVPEEARIGSDACATASEIAIVEKHLGVAGGNCGTLITRCLGGAGLPWDACDSIFFRHVINYDTQVSGQVFSVGDVVLGGTCAAQGRVLQVEDDGDCTGKIITAGIVNSCGCLCETAFACGELLTVGGTTIATVENNGTTLDSFTDVSGAVRTAQREDQGGILACATSLNIVRGGNQFFTFLQDTFDELAQLDDLEPACGTVKDASYTLLNCWVIPDLNFRFLSAGSWKTSDNNCIWTNLQTISTVEDVTAKVFRQDACCPTPQPDIYIEQGGLVLTQEWLEGHIDVLVKNKTKKDTRFICISVNALGQLINNGTLTILERSFLNTFDHFETTTIGGVAPIPLNTANDLNCDTGQFRLNYGTCGGFTIGEEFTGGTSGARATVIAECVTCNTLDYALKSSAQVSACETITGTVSAATATANMCCTICCLVAGYSDSIRLTFAQEKATGGTVGGGKFQTGEAITQAVTCATGAVVGQNSAGTELVFEVVTGAFDNTNVITDDVGASAYTPTGTATTCCACIDLADGSGNHTYNAAVGGCSDAACTPRSIQNIYNWVKFITRKERTCVIGKLGLCGTQAVAGQIYLNLVCTYPLVKTSPFGTLAGGKMFGAQGLYIDKCCVPAACNQNMALIDTAGTAVCPPNLQTIAVTGLVVCDAVAVYQAINSGCCSTLIQCMQFIVDPCAAENEAADTTIVVAAGVCGVGCCFPVCVPCCGVLRIQDPCEPATTAEFLSFPYNSVTDMCSTFTLTAGTIGTVTGCMDLRDCDDVFVAFIEKVATATCASTCVQFCASIPLLIRVRKKGIKPFQTTGCFGSTGFSTGAIRTTCSVVDLP